MRTGHIVAVVCFVSLALLPWVFLWHGWSWPLLWAGLFWLVLGSLAAIDTTEYRKRQR